MFPNFSSSLFSLTFHYSDSIHVSFVYWFPFLSSFLFLFSGYSLIFLFFLCVWLTRLYLMTLWTPLVWETPFLLRWLLVFPTLLLWNVLRLNLLSGCGFVLVDAAVARSFAVNPLDFVIFLLLFFLTSCAFLMCLNVYLLCPTSTLYLSLFMFYISLYPLYPIVGISWYHHDIPYNILHPPNKSSSLFVFTLCPSLYTIIYHWVRFFYPPFLPHFLNLQCWLPISIIIIISFLLIYMYYYYKTRDK